MRALVVMMVMALCAGCGASSKGPGAAVPTYGTVELAALCPQVHQAIDALVVSNSSAQQSFVAQMQRISDAGTSQGQAALAPLLSAARVLAQAGTGPGYDVAVRGIYPGQVAVDAACVKVGSPILHATHQR